MFTHRTEFFEVNFAVFVPVRKKNCFVYNLLELCVLQVVTNHHFQNLLTEKWGFYSDVMFLLTQMQRLHLPSSLKLPLMIPEGLSQTPTTVLHFGPTQSCLHECPPTCTHIYLSNGFCPLLDCIHLAQDKDQWQVLVTMIMNHWVL